jgi:hypothetical protein
MKKSCDKRDSMIKSRNLCTFQLLLENRTQRTLILRKCLRIDEIICLAHVYPYAFKDIKRDWRTVRNIVAQVHVKLLSRRHGPWSKL